MEGLVIAWLVGGLIANFLRGYIRPSLRKDVTRADQARDWVCMALWPLAFPSLMAGAGAALRVGYKS